MSGLQDATYLRFLFTNVISSSCDRHLSHRAAKGFQSMLAISALWVSVFEKSNFPVACDLSVISPGVEFLFLG